MELIKCADASEGAQKLSALLISELRSGKKVLWLLPGGSNIPISASIMATLDPNLTSNLSVALTDERYGPVGHADSNWKQLQDAGFNPQQASCLYTLSDQNLSLEATAQAYGQALEALCQPSDTIIGQFGMGPDGHIAGILPYTPAAQTTDFVVGYHTEKFNRITMSFQVIQACSVAFVFAFGSDKLEALQNLQQDIDLNTQPAQILKLLPNAYVFNDQIGDNV
jgi:6-phosphogluconolactonase/glucosamine-6-phosphate isomerase/deaminase